MEKIYKSRIKHKRNTHANWTNNNPTLYNGELIFVDINGELRAKVGDGVKTYTQLPFTDEDIRSLIGSGGSDVSSPTPWAYRYVSESDVLGMERDIGQHASSGCILPYSVTADVELNDEANAYNDTTNTDYAMFVTATEARTLRFYIDTQLPSDATISAMSISFKIGTSNISPAVWTTRTYVVKCGGNVLASGNFTLRTTGYVTTITVTDMSLVVSPIIEIEVTAQTTMEQNVRVFGAQVDVDYTSAKEYVSVVRQSVPVVAKHRHMEYVTQEYVDNAIANAIASITS